LRTHKGMAMDLGRFIANSAASVGLLVVVACAATAPPLSLPADAQQVPRAASPEASPPVASPSPTAVVTRQAVATPAGPEPQATTGTDEYRLDTGDELKITVFGEPDLSGNFQVSDQGDISMSLIGEVNAKNLTLRQLQRVIESRYKEGFLVNPQVSAEVVNYRPYYISGEVNKPGTYPYISGLSLRNAIATAGDFTYRADKRRVMIKSAGSNDEREVEVTPSTTIRPGDTIRVRECFFVC
jgi:polysaccharide biosynthesis/export protein VpsN